MAETQRSPTLRRHDAHLPEKPEPRRPYCPRCGATNIAKAKSKDYRGAFLIQRPLRCANCRHMFPAPSGPVACTLTIALGLLLIVLVAPENMVPIARGLAAGMLSFGLVLKAAVAFFMVVFAVKIVLLGYCTWRYSRDYWRHAGVPRADLADGGHHGST
jgi:hypothetical protein